MKIAVIGTGKTGGEVIKLISPDQLSGAYNTTNPVSIDKLAEADAAIVFVPGAAVPKLMPIVMAAGIPAVWGSTGADWPEDLSEQLQTSGSKWVIAANFSLGMNLVRQCIKVLALGKDIMPDAKYSIYETHHVHKKDAPSGTALAMKNWLGLDCDIHSERKGEVTGIHKLVLQTGSETITLEHEAHDRAIYARGAIWAAHYLVEHTNIGPGLYDFNDLIDEFFRS